MGWLNSAKEAWRNRDKLGDSNKQRELAAFLPATLEIQAAPPNPIAQWLGRALLVLFIIAVVWACVGEVNIVASAEGKIIPGSRVKQIQPLEKAVVKAIRVSEGQYVTEGQALVELDSALTGADQARLTAELHSAEMRLAVSQTLLQLLRPNQQAADTNFASIALVAMPESSEAELLLHKRLLWQQWQQYVAQRQALTSSLHKTRAEQAVAAEMVKKLQQTLPIVSKRANTMQQLHSKNFASENDYLQLEQERIQQAQDLAAEQQRQKQLVAAEQEVNQQIVGLTAQTTATTLAEVADVQRQIASLQAELNKATDINAKQILYAPVSGRVQELAINTVGGVVMEAQQLMLIVPDEEQLAVEVFLDNKDIGFVHEGLAAEIKIHTFPFTKYGVIDGKVTTISDDAIVDEQRGLIYSMQLLMEKRYIQVDNKAVKLMPGMAVTAEVQTGKRRIIEFFLAPLLRYSKEGLRER